MAFAGVAAAMDSEQYIDGIVTAHSLRDPWLRLEWSHSVLILEPRPFKLSMHETHQNPYELMRTLFFEHEPLYADEHHIRLPLIQRATTNRQRRLMAQSLVSSHVEDDRLMTAAIYTWVRRKRALECVDNIRMLHLVILHRPSPDWPLGFLRVAARPDVTATVFCAALCEHDRKVAPRGGRRAAGEMSVINGFATISLSTKGAMLG